MSLLRDDQSITLTDAEAAVASPQLAPRIRPKRGWPEGDHKVTISEARDLVDRRRRAAEQPAGAFKREAFEMFSQMLDRIKQEVIGILSKVQVRAEEDVQSVESRRRAQAPMQYQHAEASAAMAATAGDGPMDEDERLDEAVHTPYVRGGRKIGRNEPCPCGSGKKYKQCHGQLA